MTAADACRFVGAKTSSLEGAKQRTLIARDYETAFERVDVIALPMSPTGAFRLGERVAHPIQMYLSHIFTVGAPLAGLPAITVPCGLAPGNLPVGLQLTGRRFEESTRYRIAPRTNGMPGMALASRRGSRPESGACRAPNALRAPGTGPPVSDPGPRIVSAPPIRSRIR